MLSKRILRLLCLAYLSSFVTSCSVEKRRYMSGYHVAWQHHKKSQPTERFEREDDGAQHLYASLNDTLLEVNRNLVPSTTIQTAVRQSKLTETKLETLSKQLPGPIRFAQHHFWQKRKPPEGLSTEQLITRYQRRNTISLLLILAGPFLTAFAGFANVLIAPVVAFAVILSSIFINLNTREETKGIAELAVQRKRSGAILAVGLTIYAAALFVFYVMLFYFGF